VLERRALLAAGDVLANHYTAGTTGEDLSETVLTPANVNSTNFGKVFTTTLDGQVYAQILAVANVNITRGSSLGLHNVLYAATMHDSLYAIDANTGAILWQDNFTQIADPTVTTIGSPVSTAGVTTIPAESGDNALISSDIGPELGILATPTIDPNTGFLYLVADTQEFRNGSTPIATFTGGTTDIHYVQRLWAVNIGNGAVAITPTNPAIEPTTGGMVVGDTILDPTHGNLIPSFTSYNGYKFVAGPYVKGTGDNGSYVSGSGDSTPMDGWAGNASGVTGTPWGTQTPMAAGYIVFNALLQMNRVATTLINGEIYLGFASHGDNGPYYGWLLGYSASTLANNVAWVSVPTFEPFNTVSGDNGSLDAQAGFWNAGSTISTDGTYLYISTGNGAFNPNTSNFNSTYTSTDNGHVVQMPLDDDYGDTVLKLQFDVNATQNSINLNTGTIHNPNGTYDPDDGYNADGYGLKVVDYFTPSNVFELNKNDEDIGSAGVLLIPSTGTEARTAQFNNATQTYTIQNNSSGDPMLVTLGKEGRIYLIDANNLGGYNTQYITNGNETTNADPAPYDRIIGEYYYFETTPGNSGTKANNPTYTGYDIPSYFNGEIYIGLGGGNPGAMYVGDLGFNLSTFPFTTASPRTGVEPTPNFVSSNLFGGRGTTSAISANGETNGIIWDNDVTQSGTDYLAAYTASATGSSINPIYTTNQNSSRDSLTGGLTNATGVKFSLPTVFNGMVYDGTGGGSGTGGHIQGTVVGYGLLSTAYSKGDINLDGHVDAADIMPLMQALTNPTGYEAQYGVSPADLPTIGDVNGDGHFNNADLQALLNLLIGGGGSTSTEGNGGSGSLSSESQGSATNTTDAQGDNLSSPAIAPIITSSPTDEIATIAPPAPVVVPAAEVTSSSAVESVASNASDPAAAPITDPGSPSVTTSAPPVASVPVPMQISSESEPTALPTSDSDSATTSPSNESVATTNLSESAHETLFVGVFETLVPNDPSGAEKPVGLSSSQNVTIPLPQHLLPTAVDQVLLTPELDRGRPLCWHGEKQVDDDAFADDSLAGLFAQWSQWQA